MKIAQLLFSLAWLGIWTWAYIGYVWGDLPERVYRNPYYVWFFRAMMKVMGPIGILIGLVLIGEALLPKWAGSR